jgi:putative copper export protein
VFDSPYVRITNNFLHDMATGTWAACLAVLLVLRPRLAGMPAEAAAALGDAMTLVFWMLVGALVVVTITGAVRLVYWRAQTSAEELGAKRRALVVKHIAFLVIYGGGTFFGWTLLP